MSISPLDQAFCLLGAILVGLALGLFYDLIRPFRLRSSPLMESVWDLLYWFVVTLVVFFSAPVLDRGYVRIFLLLANGLGAFAYFKLFSRPIRFLSTLLDRILSRLASVFLWPFRQIETLLTAQLIRFSNFAKKTFQNIFSFPLKWYKMRKMLRRSTSVSGQSPDGEEGALHAQNKKGWSSD